MIELTLVVKQTLDAPAQEISSLRRVVTWHSVPQVGTYIGLNGHDVIGTVDRVWHYIVGAKTETVVLVSLYSEEFDRLWYNSDGWIRQQGTR